MKNKVKNALMLVSVDYGLYSKLGSPFFVISELKIFFIEHLKMILIENVNFELQLITSPKISLFFFSVDCNSTQL